MTTDSNLRILHLVSTFRWTGVAEPAASVAGFQKVAGHQVWFAGIPGRSFEEEIRARGFQVAESVDVQRHYQPFKIWAGVLSLRKFVVENRVDVVHCHLLHDHWLAALALRGIEAGARPLLVRTVHRYEEMRRDPWTRWLFSAASDLLITVSTEQRDMIASAFPQRRGLLRVVYGGVDPERFRPGLPGAAAVRADMGEKPDSMVAGIVAHLGFNRGHEWLLRAAPEVVAALPNAVVWIVGHGEIKRKLRNELRKPKYAGRVLLAGYRSTDLPETYAAMNAAMLLGLGSEGSARAALEAMSAGLPVVAVRKGALLDTITDGHDGCLVDENDDYGLAAALIKLLGDGERAERMGAAARQTVLERFTEERRFEATMSAYKDACSND